MILHERLIVLLEKGYRRSLHIPSIHHDRFAVADCKVMTVTFLALADDDDNPIAKCR